MTYAEFKNRMKVLKTFMKQLSTLERAIRGISDGGHPCIGGYLIDSYIKMLAGGLNEDLIHWYIFDNNWGKNRKVLVDTSPNRSIKSLKQLWQAIQ